MQSPVTQSSTNHRRCLVIHNPNAGRRRTALLTRVLQGLWEGGWVVELRETQARGDAMRLAEEAEKEAYDILLVAGGDGTINEAVNGLTGRSLPLGIIPLGTANVLAAEIGMPRTRRAIVRVLLAARTQRIFLGAMRHRRFVMMAGIGFDARVVAGVDPAFKRWTGKIAYVWQSLVELRRYRPVRYRINIDGQDWSAASAVIAKGHFYAGRYVCAPNARLTEDRLYVCLFSRPGRMQVIRYGLALLTGQLHRLSDVVVVPALQVALEDASGEPIQADGEIVATAPEQIRVDPNGIDLIVP